MKGRTPETSVDLRTADGVATLEARIQCRLGGHLREFRLVVVETGLILHGHVRSYYAKQLAQHAVMEATVLPILANEINVS